MTLLRRDPLDTSGGAGVLAAGAVRSSFVTAVAWTFIVAGGFGVFVTAVQSLMVGLLPRQEMDAMLRDPAAATLPGSVRMVLQHLQLIVLANLGVAAVTLISAVGLLRRREWARVLFMGMLGLGITYAVAMVVWQQSMMGTLDATLRTAAPQDPGMQDLRREIASMFGPVRIIAWVLCVGTVAVFGWILVRLASPSIRAEFQPAGRVTD